MTNDYIPSIVLLADLLNDREVLSKVSNHLNLNDGWQYLCEKVIAIEALPVDNRIQTYQKYNCGGGSPALSFLEAVKTKKVKLRNTEKDELTLKDLIATASEFERNDIVEYLKTVGKTLLKELLLSELIKLSEFLEIDKTGVIKNWKHFASYYGYDCNQIRIFGETMKAPNRYNPTEALLSDVLEIKPQFTLKGFIECLKTVNRNDVVEIVKEFEEKMQREKKMQHKKNEAAKLNEEDKNPRRNSPKKKKRKRKRKNKKLIQNEDISDCGGIRPGEKLELRHHGQDHPELLHSVDEHSNLSNSGLMYQEEERSTIVQFTYFFKVRTMTLFFIVIFLHTYSIKL